MRIAGRTALADCRGPKVLNGRTTVTGSPKERWKLWAIKSAPSFEAE